MTAEEFTELFMEILEDEMTTGFYKPDEEQIEEEAEKVLRDIIKHVRSHEFKFGY